MTPEDLLERLDRDETFSFAEVLATIDTYYAHHPTAFDNGCGADVVRNGPGENQGSCRVFAFACLRGLDEARTLACFAEHYRQVLATPEGSDHRNIRNFMKHGWAGVAFAGTPLEPRGQPPAAPSSKTHQ
jgi:hypothetical protein